jgi:vesicle-fusing ATPase
MLIQSPLPTLPAQELTYTNCFYVSEHDYTFLPTKHLEASAIGVFVIDKHPRIEFGTIGVNAVQRKFLRVERDEVQTFKPYEPPAEHFKIAIAYMEVDLAKPKAHTINVDAVELTRLIQRNLVHHILSVGQNFVVNYRDINLMVRVSEGMVNEGMNDGQTASRGMITGNSQLIYSVPEQSDNEANNVAIKNQKSKARPQLFKQKEFNFEKLGIGGLDKQFHDIFRRAFASRVVPPSLVSKLGISYVKGMLLHGPPGTGKTLIARQIGKVLNGREPKVVNGPELLNKYVGQSEENMRNLFKEAEDEYAASGEESELHVIIFDEIDAICKQRGGGASDSGVGDSMVNQLLTKIDGVHALPNILVIGMTNRKDLLDDALLRSGRLEVQVEISLPNKEGRKQIINIHSDRMQQNSFLGNDVDVEELAESTKNFSGAELEGLVKSASSFALERQIDYSDLSKEIDEDNVKVTMDDLRQALKEVQPMFGASTDVLKRCRVGGMIDYGPKLKHVLDTCRALVEQVQTSERTPCMTALLEGVPGSGKTAIAATVALESQFPFVKLFSSDNLLGLSESARASSMVKTFEDAYKSPLSLIVLDDIERLIEFARVGPRFSNVVLQALMVLVKRLPPAGHKLLVLGTTSKMRDMEALGVTSVFNFVLNVQALEVDDTKQVLREVGAFETETEEEQAAQAAGDQLPIKRLLTLVEVAQRGAKQGEKGGKVGLEAFMNAVEESVRE